MFYVLIFTNFLVVCSVEYTKKIAMDPNGELFNIVFRRKFVPHQYSGRRFQQDDVLRLFRKTEDITVHNRGSRRQVRIIRILISRQF